MNPTSVDIKDILVAEGGFAFGSDLFIGTQPPMPLNCVTLFDTTSVAPDGTLDGANRFFYETVEILVRNYSYPAAYENCMDIINILDNKANFEQGGTRYLFIGLQSGTRKADMDNNLAITFSVKRSNT
jgi:hypothetical protein